MRLTQRTGLFGGVAALSCGAVVLQIALTRLYAAFFGHPFLPVAASFPLTGAALAGVLLYLAPSIARPPSLLARLSYLAGLACAAAIGALLVAMHVDLPEALATASGSHLAALYGSATLPFLFTGLVVAAALRHAPRHAGRLYLVVLSGAAAGGVLSLGVLRAGAPRAILVAAILCALASTVFLLGSGRPRTAATGAAGPAGIPGDGAALTPAVAAPEERRANGSVVATFLLASCVLLLGDLGAPWLKITALRWMPIDKMDVQEWDELALVTADKPTAGVSTARIDGGVTVTLDDGKAAPPAQPEEMAFLLSREEGPVLVLGPSGDREIRAALKGVARDVYVAEVSPLLVNEVLRGRHNDLYGRPEVHLSIADGRGYVRRAPVLFRTIFLPLSDAATAAGAGALALDERGLYTVEGFRDDLQRLLPDGSLVVTRWDSELERLLDLATAALRLTGAAHPEGHLFACGHQRTTALLIKRGPLTKADVTSLRRNCRHGRFTESFAPDDPHLTARRQMLAPLSADQAVAGAEGLRPPTDDRPFLLYDVPLPGLVEAIRHPLALASDNQGLLVALGLLASAVLLAVLSFLGPLVLGRVPILRGGDHFARLRGLLFFGAIGAGFVFVQTSLTARLVGLLGHPVYALATVMLALLLWTGAGSLFAARTYTPAASASAGVRAQLLVGVLAAYAVGLGPLLDLAADLPFGGRLVLTMALLAPVGLLMGAQVPLGIKLVNAHAPALLAWCWGLHAVGGLLALAAGVLLAVHLGFAALLLAAGLCYLFAATVLPSPVPAWFGHR